ncbi:MAG TPA: RNA polymerase sigma factor [bacterium]|nr:RNA polymerase sigma factor [bacterium]HPN45422.1 RNA polymerase sigma factor [bacterium]
MYNQETDNNELILAAKKGDQKALTLLINQHAEAIHSFIYSLLGDRHIVEDLSQETFLRMIVAIKDYEFRAPFRSWLFRIAVNLSRDHLRRKKVRNIMSFLTTEENDDEYTIVDAVQNPFKDLEQKETMNNINLALKSLPESLRVVFLLRDVQELSYEEIADSLKWSLGTVKSRLFRARKEIANYLTQLQEEMI